MEIENPIPSESIEIPNSEANPAPAEPEAAPSEENPEEAPEADPIVPEPVATDPEAPEVELFELPDGRKVDGATLATEWKDNFMPDYTLKSQENAAFKNDPGKLPTEAPEDPYADPEYVPGSYREMIDAAKTEIRSEDEARVTATQDAQVAAENAVVEQLDAVKKLDPDVDENKLFLHANKYGFRDLSTAHQNMKDMGQITKTVQQETAKNIQKRQDPVSVNPGGQVGNSPDPSAFSSAVDFMRSLNN